MRILTVSSCPLDPMLGSGKTRLRWSEGLRGLGHEVDVMEPGDFELWHGARRAIRFRQAVGAISAVLSRIRRQRYDLVEFFGGEFGLVTRRLAQLRERPFIVAHTDGFELLASERERAYLPLRGPIDHLRWWLREHAHDRLSAAAFEHADAFVTGCELDRKRATEMGMFSMDRAAVIAPGIDAEYLAVTPRKNREPRIAFTGSWIPRKGIGLLVRVMNEVLSVRPHVQLDLYGTRHPPGVILDGFAPEVRKRITVFGRLTNAQIAERLSSAAVFLFPSQYEGFGMALAEAMACGCAPVTTPTGFGGELIDGREAIVCAFDDESRVRTAVLALLDDAGLRARIAGAARIRVEGLSWDTQIANLDRTYRSWLTGGATCDRSDSPV